MRRLLPAQVRIAHAPSQAVPALEAADVVLLEDRAWPAAEEDALTRLRELSASRRLALILSRLRGEEGERMEVPVVERPYRIDEVVSAVRLALLRRKG
ncbi:MAG TPA: hypothetical protein VI356_06885 [Myxococcales bacterium]